MQNAACGPARTFRGASCSAVLRAMAVAIAVVGQPHSPHAKDVALEELTVPHVRLPDGCQLRPIERAPFALRNDSGRRIVIGPPSPTAALGVSTNPWIGTDGPTIARIREQMEGAPDVPDAIPLYPRSAARYLLRWSEGIEEGYVASYAHPGAKDTIVLALRFAAESEHPRPKPTGESRVGYVEIGRTIAFVIGDDGPCMAAVRDHLRSLVR